MAPQKLLLAVAAALLLIAPPSTLAAPTIPDHIVAAVPGSTTWVSHAATNTAGRRLGSVEGATRRRAAATVRRSFCGAIVASGSLLVAREGAQSRIRLCSGCGAE